MLQMPRTRATDSHNSGPAETQRTVTPTAPGLALDPGRPLVTATTRRQRVCSAAHKLADDVVRRL